MSGGHAGCGGSGGGGGSGSSGRSQFRSSSGCCICGTKSSSSRFTTSVRYAEHFAGCFGQLAASRTGDLCNACVLCVKRWLQRDKQPGLFVQVLDSKKGPGPKHMKEIAKRARRREARQANALKQATTGVKSEPPPVSTYRSTCLHRSDTQLPHTGPSFATRSTSQNAAQSHTLPGSASRSTTNAETGRVSSGRNGGTCVSPMSNGSFCSTWRGRGVATSPACGNLHDNCPWANKSPCAIITGRRCCSHQSFAFCSPYPVGATFTRAAAAAIRKSEASLTHPVDKALSSSTPSRGAKDSTTGSANNHNSNSHSSTPSETSDYGSCIFGSSSSTCSRCLTLSHDTLGGCSSGSYKTTYAVPCCACCYTEATSCKRTKYDDVCTMKRACVCRGCCLSMGHSNVCCATRSMCHQACSLDTCGTRSRTAACCPPEFRHPPPPQRNCNGIQTKDMTADDGTGRSSDSAPTSPLPTTTANSSINNNSSAPSTRRYNRRVVLHPVRMTDNAEVNSLLREIMERNSQAITFDSREMHMAVQKELRLRSRTVHANSLSGSVSGRASSISSADGSADAGTNSSQTVPGSNSPPCTCTPDKHVCGSLTKRHRMPSCCAGAISSSHSCQDHWQLRHIPHTCSLCGVSDNDHPQPMTYSRKS
ncbi:hypothetical protein AHF37_00578 [Paragonimus kellicotti]|nr:hypothetical protein AHF37_00578 [Paragonimus kellicotti]